MSLYGNLLGAAGAAGGSKTAWSTAATALVPSSLRRRSGAAPTAAAAPSGASGAPSAAAAQGRTPGKQPLPGGASAAAQGAPAAAAGQADMVVAEEDGSALQGDFFDVQDEYDPARPSDFAQELEWRRAEAAQASRSAAAASAAAAAAAAATAAASASGLAAAPLPAPSARADNRPAWMAAADGPAHQLPPRADMRPAWMAAAAPSALTGPSPLAHPAPSAADAAAAAAPPAEGVQGKVERMMANWGYRVGMGLGKNEGGIITPLEVRKTGKLTGRIMLARPLPGHAPPALAAAQAAPTAAAPPPQRPSCAFPARSRVLCVTNLVPPTQEPDDGLEEDVKGEVEAQAGARVETCFLYQVCPAPAPAGHGPRVFLALTQASAAASAVQLLHGRRFAGRRACAYLFDEQRLAAWDLHPVEEEIRLARAMEE